MDIRTKAVACAAYWTSIITLLGAVYLMLKGYTYAGKQMVYTALNVVILSEMVCLAIELNEKLKIQK